MINSSTTARSMKLSGRVVMAFALLVCLPLILSLINLTFAQNWKVHFFPAAVILAAMIFGGTGGLIAGVAGSLYSSLMLGNPYLIVGNGLFGLLTGVFYNKTHKVILSVVMAFVCELPWLMISDYYFMGLSAEFIARLVIVLFLANILWAALIHFMNKPLRNYLW